LHHSHVHHSWIWLQVREFVLQKVYMLKRPKTNVQIIQQSALLKYKYFVRFLRQHGADVYSEVCAALCI
jgi:hypothetical protein